MAASPATIKALENSIAGYALKLAEVVADPNPRMNYSVGDQSFSWTEYQKFLIASMESIQKAIQALQGPYQLMTAVRTR